MGLDSKGAGELQPLIWAYDGSPTRALQDDSTDPDWSPRLQGAGIVSLAH